MLNISSKKLCIIEIILFTAIAILTETINIYLFKGVFQNYIIFISIPIIFFLVYQLLKNEYKELFLKISLGIFTVSLIAFYFVLPNYTYKDASQIILEDLKKENNSVTLDNSIEYKNIIGRSIPSAFTTKWYAVRIIDGEKERYYYFDPVSGSYNEGKEKKN